MASKRKVGEAKLEKEELDLFVDAPPDDNDDEDEEDGDTSDSEESVYSGLEEEPSSSDEEQEEDDDSSDNGDDATEETPDIPGPTSDDTTGSAGTSSTERLDNRPQPDEYEFDSSDEEDIRNTVGNIPMEWYNDYPHIGYNLDGKKIMKPAKGDELDEFLNKMDNPDYWRTVKDKTTGEDVKLTDEELDIIQQIQKGKYPEKAYNPYEPYIDFFTHEKMIHPVTNRPRDKRSFIPSLVEKEKVSKLVHAIKMGWIKPRKARDDEPKYYDIWENDNQYTPDKRYQTHIPAPKLKLPGHEESYNPPPEYLPSEEEILAWNQADPEDRRQAFLSKKYDALRKVPAYAGFVKERFERCLDLYLCPRQRKMRANVTAEDLIPKLPKPRDLQPFPTTLSVVYEGHTDVVRCISVEPTGQWLVSGSDDETLRFWEVATGRCRKVLQLGGRVRSVAWCPNTAVCLVAAVVDSTVTIINPSLGDKLVYHSTDNLLNTYEAPESLETKLPVEWSAAEGRDYDMGIRLRIAHPKIIRQVTWHGKGDYFAVVMPDGGSMSVLIHQLTKRRSQNPFRKSKGLVQCVLFHPIRPFLFVATQRYVRVYNLLKQELTKKLMANCKWVSSMAVHPGGDNLIIGSYDSRLSWFDMDLSTKPYQTLRHHKRALRQVCYHKKYPLFASASDDGTVVICHGMVYSDLLQNPLIVPVKILRGHKVTQNLGALDCQFHPTQPWIFSSGADTTVRLYT
ncbi:ribosome biogenesis protein bop1-B-like [Branchiostoma floridae x Branchiostoma belcheri]